jgi:phage shock protein PspC (stress-responsive transcriptional regulator)
MKKNININISGIIFYIEEDGYDRLKEYLLSIHRYFSSYEDSAEIIADIENRIAEIFLARLGENKQVIMVEDIDELVATMGSVQDFQAVEDNAFAKGTAQRNSTYTNQQGQGTAHNKDEADTTGTKQKKQSYTETGEGTYQNKKAPKKLYKDNKRKLIGGVAAGIAHYLGIDPLWVRLLFLATMFDWFFMVSISGFAFVAYLVLLGTMPSSDDLEEDTKIKKLFRNPDNKVLGGVASGLAAYFGVDVTVIRVLLALGMLLGGTTFIAYCILWAITPEAKTLTEKMQMEGEPITLHNIEEKVKENLNIGENQEETVLAKILLFPFRLVAHVIATLTPFLQPFGNFAIQALRIVLGIKFTLLGFVFIVAFTATLLGILGVFGDFANDFIRMGDVPVTMIAEIVPEMGVYSAYILSIIPSIALVLTGISLISRRKIVSNTFAWSLFGVWIVSFFMTGTLVAKVAEKFKHSETIEQAITLNTSKEPLVLDVNEADNNTIEWNEVALTIKGYEGKDLKVIKHITARGLDNADAMKNAQMINYEVVQDKNLIMFDDRCEFDAKSIFRGQTVKLEFLMPYNQEFSMTKKLRTILRNTVTPHGYNRKDVIDENRWVYEKGKGLRCITCEKEKATAQNHSQADNEDEDSKSFDYKNFDALVINASTDITIEQGEKFEVIVNNANAEEIQAIKISQNGKTLTIEAMQSHAPDITIKMPSITALKASGKCDITLVDFKATNLQITANDAVEIDAEIEATKLVAVLDGKASLRVKGTAKNGEFTLNGAAELYAFDLELDNATLQTDGASEAEVNAAKTLFINSLAASEANYKGEATVTGKGNFRKEED